MNVILLLTLHQLILTYFRSKTPFIPFKQNVQHQLFKSLADAHHLQMTTNVGTQLKACRDSKYVSGSRLSVYFRHTHLQACETI